MATTRAGRHVERVLMVPSQAEGSIDQYYHFLLGYLCPITLWLRRHPGRPITVCECGPMEPWLRGLPGGCDVEVISATQMLTEYVSRRQPRVVLRPLDNPRVFRADEIAEFVASVRLSFLAPPAAPSTVVVLGRGSPDAYYGSRGLTSDTSANLLRSVPNLAEVATRLAAAGRGPVHELDAALLAPRDQVLAFSRAGVLVGQHGAGLANMVWMPPGSTVVEIQPALHRRVRGVFGQLARVLGHRYAIVDQSGLHAPVDAGRVAHAVDTPAGPPVASTTDRFRRRVVRNAKISEEHLRRIPGLGEMIRRARP